MPNNLQAGGKNKPKKGKSLLSRALGTYSQARQKTPSLKQVWSHAREPSDIRLARAHGTTQSSLASKAKIHQEWIAGGKDAYKGTPWE